MKTLAQINYEAFCAADPALLWSPWEESGEVNQASFAAGAEAVKAEIATWPRCRECNGVGRWANHFDGVSVCPVCGGLGRVARD